MSKRKIFKRYCKIIYDVRRIHYYCIRKKRIYTWNESKRKWIVVTRPRYFNVKATEEVSRLELAMHNISECGRP